MSTLLPGVWSAIIRSDLTLDRETVDELHGHGIRINTWTVNEEADLARMKELGVDAADRQLPGPCRCVLQGLSRSGSPALGCAAEKPPNLCRPRRNRL